MAKATPHTWVSFFGQVSMRNYSSSYLLTHTLILKVVHLFLFFLGTIPYIIQRKVPLNSKGQKSED
jgi:hypothetical protein